MIDIHCHILPGVDDGAEDLDQAIQMARMAQQDGVTAIVATPHYILGSVDNNTREAVIQCTKKFNDILHENKIGIKILPGTEIFLTPEIPELLRKDEVISLNNTRYVLIELPMNTIPAYTEQVLYEIQLAGKVPVIAHPERNREIQLKPEILHSYASRGILFQTNTGSCTGLFGRNAAETAWKLLDGGVVSMISSDAHSTGKRAPILSTVYEQIEKKLGKDKAQQLFVENPEKIINDEEVIVSTAELRCSNKSKVFGFLSNLVNKWVVGA